MSFPSWFAAFARSVLLMVAMMPAVYASEAETITLLDNAEANLLTKTNEAKRQTEKAGRLIRTQSLNAQLPRWHNINAHLYILSNDYENAYKQARQAEQFAKEQDNALQYAEAIRKQGLISHMLHSDAEALALLTKSLKLHQALDSQYVLNNLHAIGNLYDRNDDWANNLISLGYTLAEHATRENNTFFQELGYSFVIAGMNKKEEYQAAKRVFEQALDKLEAPLHSLLYRAAMTEYGLGNYQTSLSLTDEVLGRTQQMAAFILFPVSLHRADVLVAQNKIDEGRALLLDTLEQASNIHFADIQLDASVRLATLYAQQGQFEQAAKYHEMHARLLKETFDKKQSQQLAFNRVRLEIDQKNQKIAELTASKLFSEKSNTYKTFIIILCLSLLLVLAAYSFIVARQKRELYTYSETLRKTQDTLESSNSLLRQMARTDELTGIANRRVCNEFIEAEWKRLLRTPAPISVIAIDVDYFKFYNDTYGHKQGDECLKAIAAVLRDSVHRPKDLVARYGGEEFICVLVDTPLEGALRVAADIMKNINQEAIPHKASPTFPFVTLSIGVASCTPERDQTPQSLISKADNCLYQAKHAGRNCVRH